VASRFQSFRKTGKVISSTNIKKMETNLQNFDLGFVYLFTPEPEENKQKKDAR